MKAGRVIILLISLVAFSCNIYKSYEITDKGKMRQLKEKQIKYTSHYEESRVKNFTYYLPKNTCIGQIDTNKLKFYADMIFKKINKKVYHNPINITHLIMTTDSTGYFEYKGIIMRDKYIDITFHKNKCKIVYRRASSYF